MSFLLSLKKVFIAYMVCIVTSCEQQTIGCAQTELLRYIYSCGRSKLSQKVPSNA